MSSEITRAQRTCGCCWGVCYRTGSARLQLSAKNSLAALISLAETKGVSHSHVNRSLGLAFLIAVGFNKEKCKGGLKNESSAPSPSSGFGASEVPALRGSEPCRNNEPASVPTSSHCTAEMSRKVLWAHTHQMDVLLCSPLTESPPHTVWIIFIVILISASGREGGIRPQSGELIKSCESSRLLGTLEALWRTR